MFLNTRSVGGGFKLSYCGVAGQRHGAGLTLREECVNSVVEVERVSDRIISLKLETEGVILNVV